MTDCRIYRRHLGEFVWALGSKRLRAVRQWYALCPHCDEKVVWRGRHPAGRSTRKNTKDALHQHIREQHTNQPGL